MKLDDAAKAYEKARSDLQEVLQLKKDYSDEVN
jgi:hypothetical protein